MKIRSLVIALCAMCLLAIDSFAVTAEEALKGSKEWFKSGKAWNLEFQVQVFYAESPDIVSQKGSLLVADADRFRLKVAGIEFVSDGESLWQYNPEQNQVLIKAIEDLSSAFHPSEMLFKYLECKAKELKEAEFNKQKLWVLKLDASKYAGQFDQMEVWLSKKDFSPVRLFTVDPAGNSSWYNILKLNVVKKVSADDFKFKPGKDVDEIDMR